MPQLAMASSQQSALRQEKALCAVCGRSKSWPDPSAQSQLGDQPSTSCILSFSREYMNGSRALQSRQGECIAAQAPALRLPALTLPRFLLCLPVPVHRCACALCHRGLTIPLPRRGALRSSPRWSAPCGVRGIHLKSLEGPRLIIPVLDAVWLKVITWAGSFID